MKTTAWMAADALRRLLQYHVALSDSITRADNFAVTKHQSNKILTLSGEQSASWEIAFPQIFYVMIAGESCYCYHLPSGIWNLSEEAVRKVWAGRELESAPSLSIPPWYQVVSVFAFSGLIQFWWTFNVKSEVEFFSLIFRLRFLFLAS